MGKPYASELEKLPGIYQWAIEVEIAPLVDIISTASRFPLMVVGSGGSVTAANIACFLHQRFAQRLARSLTPLEIATLPAQREVAALVITAGGRNPDAIGAFRTLAVREPRMLAVLCSAANSPISKLISQYQYSKLFEISPPSGRDGFVATNSLLAIAIVLARAYEQAFGTNTSLPPTLDELFAARGGFNQFLESTRAQASHVLDRKTLLVLFGPNSYAAASDVESKFSETALGSVQLADYRNFAHGRHHWLAAHGENTGVLAITTDDDANLAKRTLRLLPASVPVTQLPIPGSGARAAIASLVAALHFVEWVANSRGVDPGRPTIAEFGRKLYHLNAFTRIAKQQSRNLTLVAVERKSGMSVNRLRQSGQLVFWERSLDRFLSRLEAAAFSAVIFDYDGTLCATESRFSGIDRGLADRLSLLLLEGLLVGVATGRGKSVRADLQNKIPEAFWGRVWVGYYNGGQIGALNDDATPNNTAQVPANLQEIADVLLKDERLREMVELEPRSSQITVLPKKGGHVDLWDTLQQLSFLNNCSVVRSTHSVDILTNSASKINLVLKFEELLGGPMECEILRVGDLGRWPGNDYQLLAHPFGLSVDEVSSDPDSCWNLAPAGQRNTQATLSYLDSLIVHQATAHFSSRLLGFGTRQ